MSFFISTRKLVKTIMSNNIFRYCHHYQNQNHYYEQNKKKIVINLLGNPEFVDKASLEIKSFAQEKQLPTENIFYEHEMLHYFILKRKNLQLIINRCYNMSCQNVLYLNNDIINTNKIWEPYNLYVIPNVTNRFVTLNFIQNCDHSKYIIYPLSAPEENKRRDINILFE
jgi:hypothetical protein